VSRSWLVPISGCPSVSITIDDAHLQPLVQVHDVPPGPMTSLEAVQLGMALCEASKVCGELKAKGRRG
jgi:hypothetical protein